MSCFVVCFLGSPWSIPACFFEIWGQIHQQDVGIDTLKWRDVRLWVLGRNPANIPRCLQLGSQLESWIHALVDSPPIAMARDGLPPPISGITNLSHQGVLYPDISRGQSFRWEWGRYGPCLFFCLAKNIDNWPKIDVRKTVRILEWYKNDISYLGTFGIHWNTQKIMFEIVCWPMVWGLRFQKSFLTAILVQLEPFCQLTTLLHHCTLRILFWW